MQAQRLLRERSAPAPRKLLFSWEPLSAWLPDGWPTLQQYYEESEPLAAAYPLDPDFDTLAALELDGRLRSIVARMDGRFAGCACFLVAPTLFRKTVATADELVFLIAPEFRGAWLGLKLVKAAEELFAGSGVALLRYTPVSTHDVSPLLSRAGYANKGGIWEKAL